MYETTDNFSIKFDAIIKIFQYIVIVTICMSCASHKTHYTSDYKIEQKNYQDVEYSILFFGGADRTTDNAAPAMTKLMDQLSTINEGSVILLGNNGAKRGLTDSTHNKIRQKTEYFLRKKLDMLSTFNGDIYIIPGKY